ncbi:MAG: hypothetical protein J1E97_02310 [Muribaculaceae bacterium]|nr:hypothetical protein [Muribaculaceae bacterium]
MISFQFSKIYIIQSLTPLYDTLSGSQLYGRLNDSLHVKDGSLKLELIDVADRHEWNETMTRILRETRAGLLPLIDVEIHGSEDRDGLLLSNGDFISAKELCDTLRSINKASGCNLLLTLGVCRGLRWLFGLSTSQEMPFIGLVGSFLPLREWGISDRYFAFYDTLLSTRSLPDAVNALHGAVDDEETGKYIYFPIDELFYISYWNTVQEVFRNREKRDSLAKNSINKEFKGLNRRARRQKRKLYITTERSRRDYHLRQRSDKFFMIDRYPGNARRFKRPKDMDELKQIVDGSLLKSLERKIRRQELETSLQETSK